MQPINTHFFFHISLGVGGFMILVVAVGAIFPSAVVSFDFTIHNSFWRHRLQGQVVSFTGTGLTSEVVPISYDNKTA